MEQKMNDQRPCDDAMERTAWRSVGGIAAAWVDRVAVVRMAQAAADDAVRAAAMGIAAE